MRRFLVGLLVGMAAGWVVAWWRLEQDGPSGFGEWREEPMRIALPDLPGSGEEDSDVPAAEPVKSEAAEPSQTAAEDVLARARQAIEDSDPLMAYCARCRAKRPVQEPEPSATKDGRPAVRGTCPECGANMFRFVSY